LEKQVTKEQKRQLAAYLEMSVNLKLKEMKEHLKLQEKAKG